MTEPWVRCRAAGAAAAGNRKLLPDAEVRLSSSPIHTAAVQLSCTTARCVLCPFGVAAGLGGGYCCHESDFAACAPAVCSRHSTIIGKYNRADWHSLHCRRPLQDAVCARLQRARHLLPGAAKMILILPPIKAANDLAACCDLDTGVQDGAQSASGCGVFVTCCCVRRAAADGRPA